MGSRIITARKQKLNFDLSHVSYQMSPSLSRIDFININQQNIKNPIIQIMAPATQTYEKNICNYSIPLNILEGSKLFDRSRPSKLHYQ